MKKLWFKFHFNKKIKNLNLHKHNHVLDDNI